MVIQISNRQALGNFTALKEVVIKPTLKLSV